MALLRRRSRPPQDVRARLDLPHGDAVLAAVELAEGWAVATRTGLAVDVPAPEGHANTWHPWHDVDGARLDPEQGLLTVTWVDGSPDTALALAEDRPERFARVLHERVQSSVVHREAVTLPDGTAVRVALRRDAENRMFTQVIGNGRVDLRDPATAAAVDAAEARVREAAGLG